MRSAAPVSTTLPCDTSFCSKRTSSLRSSRSPGGFTRSFAVSAELASNSSPAFARSRASRESESSSFRGIINHLINSYRVWRQQGTAAQQPEECCHPKAAHRKRKRNREPRDVKARLVIAGHNNPEQIDKPHEDK